MIQLFNQFRRGYQFVSAADLPDFAADNPKRKRHEPRAESHDGKKRIPVAIPGAGSTENGKRRKIGGHHGAQQNQGSQFAVRQKIGFRGGFPARAGDKADGENDEKLSN